MGTWIKIIMLVAVLSAIGGVTFAGYTFVNGLVQQVATLKADNSTLTANNVTLTNAVAEQQKTIAAIEEDVRLKDEVLMTTLDDFASAREQVTVLKDKLSEHDLGYLAANKPNLVENIVNNATENINRCFEIATGSPLTASEIGATLRSQINTECPELANPNFKDIK